MFTLACRIRNDIISATMHFQEFVFKTLSNCPAEATTFYRLAKVGGQLKLS